MTTQEDRLLGGEALGDVLRRLQRAIVPRRTVVGWATVELDRAEVEVAAALAAAGLGAHEAGPADDDRVLGARARRLRSTDGHEVVLLEPSTEGRLAAALARHGEGSVVLYLVTDARGAERARRAGFRLSNEGHGPCGPERLVLDGPRDGPFLILASLD